MWPRVLFGVAFISAFAFMLVGCMQLAEAQNKAKGWEKEVTNSIGMKFVRIPPGKFKMGSPKTENDRKQNESQHEIEITKVFWLGIHEATQRQFKQIMGYNPSCFSADGKGKPGVKYDNRPAADKAKVVGMDTSDFPVENVSWSEAVEFCNKLSALPAERRAGRGYRLPTEAEWEYACRGGASPYQVFHFGNSLSSKQANFNGTEPYGVADKGTFLRRTCKVGRYKANAFGLFDMHGNVWEWCLDWYDEDYYARSPQQDPRGPPKGTQRVVRGGGLFDFGDYCRTAKRGRDVPDARNSFLGFRVALLPTGTRRSGQ
jgi:formylglycine-generating enzyme required for sulfatase activity